MIQYFKQSEFADTTAEICELITQLKAIRSSLMTTALTSVGKGNISEYKIETGQTNHMVRYTSTKMVLDSIEGYDRLIQMYQNKLNRGPIRLVGQQNFRQQ